MPTLFGGEIFVLVGAVNKDLSFLPNVFGIHSK